MNRGARELAKFFQSMQEVAPRLGVKPSMLSLLVDGKRKPSIEVAAAIEREFGVPCRFWVEEEPDPPVSASPEEP
jgi:plasmid maintenance system antidote protein VapI